ncbi:hypothetical protein [Flavicella sediminum]|uniref:hypothetical protein n=1 Tax=Flavicella sediminum TaxID=2585141 RepID=UPI001122F2CD|nr:hypothetical protein [Flavicella sediminum]
MNTLKNIKPSIFLLCILFGLYGVGKSQSTGSLIKHAISVIHPGVSAEKPLECTLVEATSRFEPQSTYYMDVESVLCGSKECKVVTVRIHWDELGRYKKFEMRNGAELEKNEGKPFTKEDYLKMDQILKDLNSPLQEFYKDELVDNSHANAADALSGATVVIDKNAVVEGAVWTCYTLWYWANGGVVSTIRNMTDTKLNLAQLHRYLKGSNKAYKIFALEQITARKAKDIISHDLVVSQALTSKEFLKLGINYFEKITPENYFSSMEKLFSKANTLQKTVLMDSFLSTDLEASKEFYDAFGVYFSQSESYQVISLLFDLMIRKNENSSVLIEQTLPLLQNENILISRRAYWFLKKRKLNKEQNLAVQQFANKHKGML